MVVDASGRLWIGSFGAGVWVCENGRAVPLLDAHGEHPSRRISRLLLDGHRLWVATAGEGLLCYDTAARRWLPVDPDPGPKMRALHGLARTADGRLLLGSVGSGAAELRDGVWHHLGRDQGLGDDWVNDIAPTTTGAWFATSRGVWHVAAVAPSASFGFLSSAHASAPRVPPPPTADAWLYPGGSCCGPDAWDNPEVNVLLPLASFTFLGTMADGAFRHDPDGETRKLAGTRGSIQALCLWRNALWIAGSQGLWQVGDPAAPRPAATQLLTPWEPGVTLKSLAVTHRDSLLIGTHDGRIFATSDGKTFSLALQYADGGFRQP
ncbi:MAG: hypothetical protein OZSIB_2334 [Candidatus Ozemobacter sibiricus]|uniref:Uncharacterized protein n=1 Tax=Candidatus Ozemobacter sibiricus TaxID=2268124 RepID=A0A367ZSY2_9BACT|nr:MAG: hypothetical protein OZSIB_2334 [Candidatus Ozemobacter sibiricus]